MWSWFYHSSYTERGDELEEEGEWASELLIGSPGV